MRTDPRYRQSLNRLATSLESASDSARASCFTFTKSYIEPCFTSLSSCCTSCFPSSRSESRRHIHHHHHHHHRSEYPFGFYDYEDDDDDDAATDSHGGFLAWGNDELDRLLAGSGAHAGGMHYGPPTSPSGVVGRRKTAVNPHEGGIDPTVIPTSSMFGFLARFGTRGKVRYKPSAANLMEHPQRRGRKRSVAGSSEDSSLRSRGDLWPSEDEDDAVPIGDDVFPERDASRGGSRGRSRDHGSGGVTPRDAGSGYRISLDGGGDDGSHMEPLDDEDLIREEEELRMKEEEELERKREAARKLAIKKGLSIESIELPYPKSISDKSINSAPSIVTALSTTNTPNAMLSRSPVGPPKEAPTPNLPKRVSKEPLRQEQEISTLAMKENTLAPKDPYPIPAEQRPPPPQINGKEPITQLSTGMGQDSEHKEAPPSLPSPPPPPPPLPSASFLLGLPVDVKE